MPSRAWRKFRQHSHFTANSLRSGNSPAIKEHLPTHFVSTTFELNWSNLKNGDLLVAAESSFDLFITTDQQIRYQQNLVGRRQAILVLLSTSWPQIKTHVSQIDDAVEKIKPGEYVEIRIT